MKKTAQTTLALLLAFTILCSEPKKLDSCGFKGNIHDCHCAERVSAIRQLDVHACANIQSSQLHDQCVRRVLAGHGQCDIAERNTQYDFGDDGEYPIPEGDHASSKMGEYCKHACAPHQCKCTEQTCNF